METDVSPLLNLTGLTESEAQARLAADGPNELPQPDRRTPFRIVLEVLREPMFALLLGGGAIYDPPRLRGAVNRHHRRSGDADRARP